MTFSAQKLARNERFWLIFLSIIGLFLIFGTFFKNLSFPDSNYNFFGATNKAKLDPGKPITQIFTAKKNYLNQIKIIVGDINLLPTEKIVFELMDDHCENVIAQDAITFLTPDPHIYYHFNFATLPDSKEKRYCFRATYVSSLNRDKKRPYLGASEDNQFPNQSYYNEGNGRLYKGRMLQIRPAYGTQSFFSDLLTLNDRLSQYKPGFLKGSALIIIFSVFVLGTIVLLWKLSCSQKEQ